MTPTSPAPLILASGSPYRAEMLRRLGLPFEVLPADLDETPHAGETPRALAERLALDKARAVHRQHPDAWVLGADQVAATDDGRCLGKPGDARGAVEQLTAMRGRLVTWHSGLALVGPGSSRSDVIDTVLKVRDLSDREIDRYVERDRPFDCAGAMRSESLGITLVERMSSDDPTALIGLPLITVSDWLRAAGWPVP